MAAYDFRTQRLFVDADLREGGGIAASREQSNYLLSVLRMKQGDPILLFNGRDGEWLARIEVTGRKACDLVPERRTRDQPQPYSLTYCFAPLKRARLDYMVQKAVEMGVGILQPVRTEYTQQPRLNEDRMQANAREAAEQCGILSLPEIRPMLDLREMLEGWAGGSPLIFCDESAEAVDPAESLAGLSDKALALLIGPEGGFSPAEREMLLAREFVIPISLGPRILRADTAAVAALAAIQLIAGDWRAKT